MPHLLSLSAVTAAVALLAGCAAAPADPAAERTVAACGTGSTPIGSHIRKHDPKDCLPPTDEERQAAREALDRMRTDQDRMRAASRGAGG